MVGADVINLFTKFKVTSDIGVEDFADRFNFLYTVIVLLVCGTICTVKQYMLKPISCYLANDPGGINLLEYVENFCWVQGTIANYMNTSLPETEDQWENMESKKILYYQWVPFVLGLQSILFYIPRVIWQLVCYNRTGTDLQNIVNSANDAVRADFEAREKMVGQMSRTLESMMFQHREYRNNQATKILQKIYKICNLFVASKRMGTWLVFIYLLLKICYVVNAFGQLALMQRFLGFEGTNGFYGLTVLHDIRMGKDWRSTLAFPRVTYCAVSVKQLGRPVRVTAQCVLPMNMLNEKIYIFLWYWIFLNGVITTISIPVWFYRVGGAHNRQSFVKKYLKLGAVFGRAKSERSLLRKFTSQFLRHDGIFILQMISLNAGDLIASDIVCQLWKLYKENKDDQTLCNFPPIQNEKETSFLLCVKSLKGISSSSQHPTSDPAYHRHPSAPAAGRMSSFTDDEELEKPDSIKCIDKLH